MQTLGRARPVDGAILEIATGDGRFSYAQALSEPLVGFFDGCFSESQGVENLEGRPFKFTVWVHRDAFKRWRQIGNAAVPPEASDHWFYIRTH